MKNRDKIFNEINNKKELIKELINEISKLENKVIKGALSKDEAIRYANKFENSIQKYYLEINKLEKQLL